MPLIISEPVAVQIIAAERDRRGTDSGLKNFARVVLGAHTEQASRLVREADRYAGGTPLEGLELHAHDEPDVQVTREVEGRELNLVLKADRLPVTTFEELVSFFEIDLERWQPRSQRYNFWGSSDNPQFQVRADFVERPYQGLAARDREAVREFAAQFAPDLPDLEWFDSSGESCGRLLEIMVADLHAAKFVENRYDLEESLYRMRDGIKRILRRANVDGIEHIALVFNGDTFNDDGRNRTTTKGTPQESEGRWQTVFSRIREEISEVAVLCGYVAPTTLYILPGNHDRERAYYLQDALSGWLSKHPHIEVVTDFEDRAYIDWGVATIGLTHGDEAKPPDLAMTLLRETDPTGKHVWEWHLGHIHTRRIDELHGVTLRRFRSPSEADEWHRKRTFSHNTKDIVGIIWDRELGQVAEYPVAFLTDARG